MSELHIEMMRTKDIVPYKNNAKIHTDEQIEQIKSSIKEFGFNDPVAIWKNNEIVEGHGRLIAAEELGIKEIPIIRLDALTNEQRKAYALVHNKLTMNTGFDIDLLNSELLNITSLDMSVYGLQTHEAVESDLDRFFNSQDPITETEEKNRIQFTVTTDESRSQFVELLEGMGLEYEEY